MQSRFSKSSWIFSRFAVMNASLMITNIAKCAQKPVLIVPYVVKTWFQHDNHRTAAVSQHFQGALIFFPIHDPCCPISPLFPRLALIFIDWNRAGTALQHQRRSEENTSEIQSLMRLS